MSRPFPLHAQDMVGCDNVTTDRVAINVGGNQDWDWFPPNPKLDSTGPSQVPVVVPCGVCCACGHSGAWVECWVCSCACGGPSNCVCALGGWDDVWVPGVCGCDRVRVCVVPPPKVGVVSHVGVRGWGVHGGGWVPFKPVGLWVGHFVSGGQSLRERSRSPRRCGPCEYAAVLACDLVTRCRPRSGSHQVTLLQKKLSCKNGLQAETTKQPGALLSGRVPSVSWDCDGL